MEHLSLTIASASWLNDFECIERPTHPILRMKACPPATDHDPRHLGWPCHGEHLPGKERANGPAMWQACSRCGLRGLRLRYVTKGQATGQTTAIGPPPPGGTSAGTGRARTRFQAIRDDGEDLQCKADGNQGPHPSHPSDPSVQRRTRPNGCSGPGGREAGGSLDGVVGMRRLARQARVGSPRR